MTERSERCETCRFWEPMGSIPPVIGVCRRRSPVFVRSEINNSAYPHIGAMGWCGDWQANREGKLKEFLDKTGEWLERPVPDFEQSLRNCVTCPLKALAEDNERRLVGDVARLNLPWRTIWEDYCVVINATSGVYMRLEKKEARDDS